MTSCKNQQSPSHYFGGQVVSVFHGFILFCRRLTGIILYCWSLTFVNLVAPKGAVSWLKCHYDEILDTHFFTFSYTIGLS